MATEDWKGILVPAEDCTKVYEEIFAKLGILDVIKVKTNKRLKLIAQEVGKIANSSYKKPLIIGLNHALMAYVDKDSTDFIYFDAHSDDGSLAGENPDFGCGTFIHFMDGRHYIVGVPLHCYPERMRKKAILIDRDEPQKILEQSFRDNLFLSYDIDVFHDSVTRASEWCDGLGRMFPEQVKDLSAKILQGRNLVGINVAEYLPFYERDNNYKTADLIVDLVKPLI
jgi:arginase family enzyme